MYILLVEDDGPSRRVLKFLLEKWGYEVLEAASGEAAWTIFSGSNPPQLAIIDWIMPGMNGLELCCKVRSSPDISGIYLILLTGKNKKQDIVAGLDAGADDYIPKPYDSEELQAKIRVGERIVGLQTKLAKRVNELERALAHIKKLQGMIPICMHCHSIRDDHESWHQLEAYIEEHSDAQFSHGVCPKCMEKFYGDLKKNKKKNQDK